MSNLQKRIRQTFPGIFFLATICFVKVAYTQALAKPQPENQSVAIKNISESEFARPFRNVWSSLTDNIFSATNASDNVEVLLLSTLHGKISLINSETGKVEWETDLGGIIKSEAIVEKDKIYVLTAPVFEDGNSNYNKTEPAIEKNTNYLTARSLDLKTGLTVWQTKIPASSSSKSEAAFLSVRGKNLVIVGDAGNIICLSEEDGMFLWNKSLDSKLSAKPYFSGDSMILATVNKQVLFVSVKDGNIVDRLTVSEEVSALNRLEKRKFLILGGRKGNVSAIVLTSETPQTAKNSNSAEIKPSRKSVWKFRNGAEISDITATDIGILISSYDNFLYLITEDAGELIWKKRLGGRASATPLVSDGYIVVTNVAEPSASILELSSGKIVNKISLPDENYFIGKPLYIVGKLILTTQKGVFAFEPNVPK